VPIVEKAREVMDDRELLVRKKSADCNNIRLDYRDTPYSSDPSASPAPLQDPIYLATNPPLPLSRNSRNPTSGAEQSMTNFPVNRQPYLIAGLALKHGWNRLARGRIALGGEPTREHEDYVIVSINPNAGQCR